MPEPESISEAPQIEPNPDFEFLDAAVLTTPEFVHEDPWRVLRLQSDAIQSIEMMARSLEGCCRTVAAFGSARSTETAAEYRIARETCRHLGELGFGIITGGGPGVMEAANRGAREAGARSIGLNIRLPQEQRSNPYCDASYTCHYFFVRKMMFAKYARGFIIFPGGFGTLDEMFESLTLIQTGKLANFPVVLVGADYWAPLIDWLESSMAAREFIDDADIERFVVLDSPHEVAEHVNQRIPQDNESD